MQYVPQGHFISPVIDLGQDRPQPVGQGDRPLLTPASIESVALKADAVTPDGTRVELAFRTGRSPVYEAAALERLATGRPQAVPAGASLPAMAGRAGFPRSAAHAPAAERGRARRRSTASRLRPGRSTLKTVAFHNERIRSTSLPFEYEDPLHPRLVALAAEVQAGCRGRRRGQRDGAVREAPRLGLAAMEVPSRPRCNYPAWDADEILRRKYGFCVQYAVVLMQSALSLGHQARFFFGENPGGAYEFGHEVCEIWSNEHRKWIFMDGNVSLHYIDPKTKVPMSILEVHDLLEKTYYQGRPATLANRPQERQLSDAIAICFGSSMTPGGLPERANARTRPASRAAATACPRGGCS